MSTHLILPKNPTYLTYDVSAERHNCSTAIEAEATTSVCVFKLSGDFLNIGHAAQILIRCWCFFRSMPGTRRFLLEASRPRGWKIDLVSRPWQQDLVRAMGAARPLCA